MIKVMCAGTFDVVHQGHLHYFKQAKQHGDYLIVVVARDITSEKLKGRKPVHGEKERLEKIKSLKIVNEAVLGKEGNILDILNDIKPDIICLGYDQKIKEEKLEEELKSRKIKAKVLRIGPYKEEFFKSSKILKN